MKRHLFAFFAVRAGPVITASLNIQQLFYAHCSNIFRFP